MEGKDMKITKEGSAKFFANFPFLIALDIIGPYHPNHWQWWLMIITALIPVMVYEHYAKEKI
jgi:hypothetical protein